MTARSDRLLRLAIALLAGSLVVAGAAMNRAHGQPRLRCDNDGKCVQVQVVPAAKFSLRAKQHSVSDPRPRAWCGWWMRHHLGVADHAFNRARRWTRYGVRASGPAVDVIVVWRHHVGIITGRADDGRWIVKSGNDGHRVRERPRSLRGAIAFRRPEQRWASR